MTSSRSDTGCAAPSSEGGSALDRSDAETSVSPPPVGAEGDALDEDVPLQTRGRYVTLEMVGRGGMGRVHRAYDPKLQREVALKELRRASQSLQARLVAEARAMARLSHPNVVAVYDVEAVGTEDDERLVLVMEYVPGKTLLDWINERPRSWQEIVDKFVDAGRGLAAAHSAGMLHRDFKPANVLVAASGDGSTRDVVKVTDFGLAELGPRGRALTASADDGSLTSGAPTRDDIVAGTPRYMSPEQHSGLPLRETSDQYSFCIALWEALCDAPPFRRGKGLPERKAAGPPQWDGPRVPGPIVHAVTRGLSPKPEDRWPSIEALLDELMLDPIRQRRRAMTLTAAGAVAVVGLAAWGLWAQAQPSACSGAQDELAGVWDDDVRARVGAAMLGPRSRFREAVWTRTSEALDDYGDRWVEGHVDACEATAIRGEQSAARMDLRMSCLRRARTQLDAVVKVLSTGDEEVVDRAHRIVGGLDPVSRCADVDRLSRAGSAVPEHEAEAVALVRASLAASKAALSAGRLEDAANAIETARADAQDIEYLPVHSELAYQRGLVLDERVEYEEAEASLREALDIALQAQRWDLAKLAASVLMNVVGQHLHRPDEALRYREFALTLDADNILANATAHDHLGLALAEVGDHAASEAAHRRSLELLAEAGMSEAPHAASIRNNLGTALNAQGKYAEADQELRVVVEASIEQLGEDHPSTARAYNNLGVGLYMMGRREEAAAEYKRAVAIWSRVKGAAHPDTITARTNYAATLAHIGDYREAQTELEELVVVATGTHGPEHRDVGSIHENLVEVLKARGHLEEAEKHARLGLQIYRKALKPGDALEGIALLNLADVVRSRGRPAEASKLHEEAIEVLEKAVGAEHMYVAVARHGLGRALADQKQFEAASVQHRLALAIMGKAVPAEHPDTADIKRELAVSLFEMGPADPERIAEAQRLIEESWERLRQDDVPAARRAWTRFGRARIRHATATTAPERQAALEEAREAASTLEQNGDAESSEHAEIAAWLGSR